MKPRAGSIAWLARHEGRLYWRGLEKNLSGTTLMIVLLVLLHLVAIPVAYGLKHAPALQQRTAAIVLTLGGCFVLLLMISRSLITAVQALYARGDMDLMISAPIEPRTVITVRALFIASAVTWEFGALIWPFTNVFVLFGLFGWLKAYVLLPALGLLATSVSLLLALLLFHLFGARRTRVFAQVLSALIAVAFAVLMQLPNIMRHSAAASRAFGGGAQALLPWLNGLSLEPALLVMGGVLPALAMAVACMVVFALMTSSLANSFIRASVASAGVSVGKRARRVSSRLRFYGGLRRVLILKELRLIARDPWLLTQLLQQMIFVLPMAVVLWRQGSTRLPYAWETLILIAGFMASALAWITISAEDVPELMAAAPVANRVIVSAKLEAAVLPVLPLLLLPVAVLWRSHLWFAISVSFCALGAAICSALMHVHDRTPGKRRDFRARGRSNVGRGFVELFIDGAWIGVCGLMVWLSPWR